MSRPFQEIVRYRIEHDRKVSRLSICDDRGSEFYVEMPLDRSKGWRDRRNDTLDLIEDAIDRGDQPGEVKIA